MDMKILCFLFVVSFLVGGCSDNAPKTETKTEAQEQLVQTYTVERYKLFPTQNMWTFIKLDTQTGQMWQLQYSIMMRKDGLSMTLILMHLLLMERKLMVALNFTQLKTFTTLSFLIK